MSYYQALIVGGKGVGKSTIKRRVHRHLGGEGKSDLAGEQIYMTTVQFDSKSMECEFIELSLGDTVMLQPMMGYANALVLVYDISTLESFLEVKSLYNILSVVQKVPTLLIGNKKDLIKHESMREVSLDEAQQYANSIGAPCLEMSALYDNDEQIQEPFANLAREMTSETGGLNEAVNATGHTGCLLCINDEPAIPLHVERLTDLLHYILMERRLPAGELFCGGKAINQAVDVEILPGERYRYRTRGPPSVGIGAPAAHGFSHSGTELPTAYATMPRPSVIYGTLVPDLPYAYATLVSAPVTTAPIAHGAPTMQYSGHGAPTMQYGVHGAPATHAAQSAPAMYSGQGAPTLYTGQVAPIAMHGALGVPTLYSVQGTPITVHGAHGVPTLYSVQGTPVTTHGAHGVPAAPQAAVGDPMFNAQGTPHASHHAPIASTHASSGASGSELPAPHATPVPSGVGGSRLSGVDAGAPATHDVPFRGSAGVPTAGDEQPPSTLQAGEEGSQAPQLVAADQAVDKNCCECSVC